jgi:hypothetical protein
LGEIRIKKPHVLCTAKPPGPAGPVGAADPTGATGPAPWHDSGPEHPHSHEHNLEARITSINGPTYPIAQPPQPSSKGNPRRPRARSVYHTVWGRAGHTYQLACREKLTQGANLQSPQEPTYKHPRSSDQECPRREATHPRAGHA